MMTSDDGHDVAGTEGSMGHDGQSRRALPYVIELGRVERKQAAFADAPGSDPVQADSGPVALDSVDDRGPVSERSDVVVTSGEKLARTQAERRVSEKPPRCHVVEHRVNAVILTGDGVPAGYMPAHVRVQYGSDPGVVTACVEEAPGIMQAAEQIRGSDAIEQRPPGATLPSGPRTAEGIPTARPLRTVT